jgi:hypothetical protein
MLLNPQMEFVLKFSQRAGITAVNKIAQVNSIDGVLRNSLWNVLTICYWETFDRPHYSEYGGRADYLMRSNLGILFQSLWINYFKNPLDRMPEYYFDENGGLGILRSYYFNAKWYEIYDFLEFVASHGPKQVKVEYLKICNNVLEKENSAYRFVDGIVVEISSKDEIEEVQAAIDRSAPYFGAKEHLRVAITLLSDKEAPDYRNSIKESISAVESLCKSVSEDNKATLGEALKVLERKKMLHPALKSAFSSLYGFTSDAGGIRHALVEESNLNLSDARFMLICCSAFINYVISAASKDV